MLGICKKKIRIKKIKKYICKNNSLAYVWIHFRRCAGDQGKKQFSLAESVNIWKEAKDVENLQGLDTIGII